MEYDSILVISQSLVMIRETSIVSDNKVITIVLKA